MAIKKQQVTLDDPDKYWEAWDTLVEEVQQYAEENDYIADKMYYSLYLMAQQVNPPVGHWRLGDEVQTFKELSRMKPE